MNNINQDMLELARDSRGLTQAALADATGINQGHISRYERGLSNIPPDNLEKIAQATSYPVEFFYQSDAIRGLTGGCFYHRKRQSMPVQELKVIQAHINVIRIQVSKLLRGAEIITDNRFARLDISEEGTPEHIARVVRASWELPLGPLKNLTNAIENAGGIVFRCSFRTDKLDAVSQWAPGLPPLFFVNADIPTDRARFTLAHELGHLIMHKIPTPDSEGEADRFASEFLMPARDIAADLNGFSLQRAAVLKPYWRVSMASLIRRAKDIGKITDWQYKNLNIQKNKLNGGIAEPIELPPERPTVLRDLIRVYLDDHGYTVSELSGLVCLLEDEFRSRFLPDNPIREGFRVIS